MVKARIDVKIESPIKGERTEFPTRKFDPPKNRQVNFMLVVHHNDPERVNSA